MIRTFTSFLALKDPVLLASLGLPTPDTLPLIKAPLRSDPPLEQWPPALVRSAKARQDQEMHLVQEQAAQTRKAIEEIQRQSALAREVAAAAAAGAEATALP